MYINIIEKKTQFEMSQTPMSQSNRLDAIKVPFGIQPPFLKGKVRYVLNFSITLILGYPATSVISVLTNILNESIKGKQCPNGK
ncbi:hypothetical protein [Sodalis ligni]|uniref:hypothetical protein n=1 Tax=Sodalis ligni TaxID=2697027 RepID=UPI00104B08F2|nr:hypothetical protein [Sodalis ligni]